MITELHKKTAQAIINIFETGSVEGDYAKVVSVVGDRGGLTYGRSQTTLTSGNLFKLLKAYCEAENADFAEELRPYLAKLETRDTSLNTNKPLQDLLKKAGGELVMPKTQDIFFDEVYWNPSAEEANRLGIQTALGMAVVFDSFVHGSWGTRRKETTEKFGSVEQIGEQTWIKQYIDVRRKWLLSNPPSTHLPKTVYRMDAFKQLIAADNWDLTLPLTVRERLIDEQTLPVQFRQLRLRSPFMRGQDVRELQEALNQVGVNIKVDGVFGQVTDTAVKQFQKDKNLIVDGIVGPATRIALGL